MALKGVCSVEVRNADGTLAQKTTDENMVTNYLSNLINPDYEALRNFFNINEDNFSYSFFPLIDNVIGGVVLYSENIPEDPNYKFPKAPIVGHASSTQQFDWPSIGIFNKNESTILTNNEGNITGYKFVWDFATDRANGTIKCISLTTGRYGTKGRVKVTDTNSNAKAGSIENLFLNPIEQNTSDRVHYALNVFQTSTSGYLFSADSKKYGSYYKINYSGYSSHKMIFDSDMPVANFEKDIIIIVRGYTENSITFARTSYKKTIGINGTRDNFFDRMEIVNEKNVQFDTDILNGYTKLTYKHRIAYSNIYTDDEYLYVSRSLDGDMTIYKIDPITFDIIDKKIAQTTIDGVGVQYSQYRMNGCIYYKGCYYTIRTWDSNDGTENRFRNDIVKINANNTSEFETIITIKKESSKYPLNYEVAFSIFDDLLFIGYPGMTYIINESGVLNEYTYAWSNGHVPIYSANLKFPFCLYKVNSSVNSYHVHYIIGYGVCTQGLITIDNLSTPIVKNSTQTMKITYEITETE